MRMMIKIVVVGLVMMIVLFVSVVIIMCEDNMVQLQGWFVVVGMDLCEVCEMVCLLLLIIDVSLDKLWCDYCVQVE